MSENSTTVSIPLETLWKDQKHDHFWIADGILYESYKTIRGLRYRSRMAVPLMPDCEKCTNEMLLEVAGGVSND
jgi:hypothetical protein